MVNNTKYLHNFIERKIRVTLGTSITGQFEGTGLVIASTSERPSFIFSLLPAMFASNDPCCTMTTRGLMKYSGFNSVIHYTSRTESFVHNTGPRFSLPCKTEVLIDLINLALHPANTDTLVNNRLSLVLKTGTS